MGTWRMSCTCGESFQSEGENKEAAVDSMMAMMTPEAMKQHMDDKHPGEPMPSPAQAREGMLASAQPL